MVEWDWRCGWVDLEVRNEARETLIHSAPSLSLFPFPPSLSVGLAGSGLGFRWERRRGDPIV